MTDERTRVALDNWGPRFLVRGVDYGDLLRLKAAIHTWDDWLPAWAGVAEEHAALGREWEGEGNLLSAGQAWNRAALGHHFARFLSVDDEAAYLAASQRAVDAMRQAHRLLDPSARRIEIRLADSLMVANLRLPPGRDRPPLVVLIPGLDSTKEEFLSWENVLLARGLATISLDGPGQGEGGYGHGLMRPDYERAVTALLDALSALGDAGVDLDRVGAAGVSLGGYYVVRALAFETRLRAAVAIGGPYDIADCWDRFPPLSREKAMFHLGIGDETQAMARLADFNLRDAAPAINRPLLIVFGRLDRLVPPAHAERLAAEVRSGRLVMYESGNHCCTNLHWRHTPLEADWLAHQLLAPL